MSEGELTGFHLALDLCRQAQQAEKVSNGGTVLAGAFGHLLLSHLKLAAEAVEGARLLHGVEVGALEIFDDGHLHRLFIGGGADDRRDGGLAGVARGHESALSGDELIPSADNGTDQDRLHDARGGDRGRELLKGGLIELAAGLEGISVNKVDGKLERSARGGIRR